MITIRGEHLIVDDAPLCPQKTFSEFDDQQLKIALE